MGISGRSLPVALVSSWLLLLLHAYSPQVLHAESLQWIQTYNGSGNSADFGNGVALAPDGSVCVVGGTTDWEYNTKLLLQQYSPAGILLWTKTYAGSGYRIFTSDEGYGVAVAGDGSIYVTGRTMLGARVYYLLLQKYSSTGELLWTKTHKESASAGFGVTIAGDGSVYVTGSTGGNLLLQKYSASGILRWTKTQSAAVGNGVAVATDGGVYVVGTARAVGEQKTNLLLKRYSPGGRLRWTRMFNGASNGDDYGHGAAIAPSGNVYVVGGTSRRDESFDLLVQKYSPAGTLLWKKTYNGADNLRDGGSSAAIAANGGVYVAGYSEVSGQKDNLLLQKYSPSGIARQTHSYDGATSGVDCATGVAVAAEGSVYVTGFTHVEGQDYNLLLLKYK